MRASTVASAICIPSRLLLRRRLLPLLLYNNGGSVPSSSHFPSNSNSYPQSNRTFSYSTPSSSSTMDTGFSRYELPEKRNRMECECKSSGLIHLIAGPMFSGKTTELFRLCNRHSLAKRKVVVVKYARDNRYDDVMICTHDLRKMHALSAVRIADIFEQLAEHDVIGIDEGQFFEDICEMSEKLAQAGRTVIIAALNSDYKREPFLNVSRLFALAEKIEKLNAVCRFCGNSASFTLRTVRCDKREVIGGQEMYQAACRKCYDDLSKDMAKADRETATLKSSPQKDPTVTSSPLQKRLSRQVSTPHCQQQQQKDAPTPEINASSPVY